MKDYFNPDDFRKGFLVASILSVILAFLYVACGGGSIDFDRKHVSESLAKFGLRAYGETERAYALNSSRKQYGSWENLRQRNYISAGVTRENFITDYSLWTSVSNPVRNSHTISPLNTFTGVAFPRITRPPGFLATFAIREDQVVRVYLPVDGVNAWGENDDYGTKTWEPVE